MKWTDYLSSNLSIKWIALISLLIAFFFEIGYCGYPNLPYAHIQLKQATKLILSHFQEDHLLIHDTLKNKKTQLVSLYFVYRPKENEPRTDITNDDKKDYAFANIWRWIH